MSFQCCIVGAKMGVDLYPPGGVFFFPWGLELEPRCGRLDRLTEQTTLINLPHQCFFPFPCVGAVEEARGGCPLSVACEIVGSCLGERVCGGVGMQEEGEGGCLRGYEDCDQRAGVRERWGVSAADLMYIESNGHHSIRIFRRGRDSTGRT